MIIFFTRQEENQLTFTVNIHCQTFGTLDVCRCKCTVNSLSRLCNKKREVTESCLDILHGLHKKPSQFSLHNPQCLRVLVSTCKDGTITTNKTVQFSVTSEILSDNSQLPPTYRHHVNIDTHCNIIIELSFICVASKLDHFDL